MFFGSIQRVIGCVLLMASGCAAQRVIAEAPDLNRCVQTPDSIACLPEAPSASRRPESFSAGSLPAVMAGRKPSPAERPFVPLSARQKFDRFLHSMYSPYTIFSGAYDATWSQAMGDNYRYGGGMEGWGKRLGAAYATTATHQFLGTFLLPTVLHQDPRYFAMSHGSVWKRFVHAASRTVLTKGDDGSTQVDVSGLLAMAGTETLENTWLPPGQRSLDKTLNRVAGSLQATATSYVLREFTPDIVRFFKGHSPKRLRRLEDKIPERMISGVAPGDE